ncbi:ABC transporter substrate-binding protein [Jatrophihabitans sp. DSM 45814]
MAAGAGAVLLLAGCSSSDSSASGAAASSGPALTASTIEIGTVGTFSGVAGDANKNMPALYASWAKWVNNGGGLNGHPVKFDVVDDHNDAATAQSAVKDLVENKHVVAIVGAAEAGLESTWASYVESKNIPVVGGYSYTPLWTTSPMFFPSTATLTTAVFSGAFMTKSEGKSTYGVVNCTEVAACAAAIDFHKAAAAAAGMKFGYGATASATAPNYTSNCLAAKNAGVDALSLAIEGGGSVRMASDCKRQGYTPEYIFNATSVTPDVLASPNVDGAAVPLTTFPAFVDDSATADFHTVADQAKISDKNLGPAEATAWVSAQLFATIMRPAPATVTNQTVLDALYTVKDQTVGGLTGPLTFSKTVANNARAVNCYYEAKISDHKLVAPQGLKASCIS